MTTSTAPTPSWVRRKARAELARIREAKAQQTYPLFREFESGGLHTAIAGRPITNFSSNDYLGLTHHPRVKEVAKRAIESFACGLSSSRPQATTPDHVRLEERLARWMGFERCLVFTTGYQAMLGTISALADKDTTLVVDAYSHACILEGSFLACGTPQKAAELRFFNHNSAKSLERVLQTRERPNALVLCEGVYSLDGDVANLRDFVAICERHGAALVVDDAHGTGTLGAAGRGTLEALGLEGRVPVLLTALSKTFGGIGGVLFGPADVVDHVKHAARSFLFSASLPVPVVAAVSEILDLLERDGPSLVSELHEKAAYFREGLTRAGFDLGASSTHIMPILCRDPRKAIFMHIALLECGVMMIPIVYPAVKAGEERLRVNVTRGHSREDLHHARELLERYGEAFFVLSGEEIGPPET